MLRAQLGQGYAGGKHYKGTCWVVGVVLQACLPPPGPPHKDPFLVDLSRVS